MNGSSTLNNNLNRRRILFFAIILVTIFIVFTGRLFYLQIIQREEWVAKASENNTQLFNFPALRGIIYDRNGTILARNIASYNITITAAELPDDTGAVQSRSRLFKE